MIENYRHWRGYFAATPTPFLPDGRIDLAALEEVIDWFLSERPHGMVVNGTTGEWFAQTLAERQQVVEVARSVVPTTLPLLVGISDILPANAWTLGKHAESVGADGVLLTIPPARRLGDDEIINYFERAAYEISLPILIYNVPSVTGYDLPSLLMRRLLTIKGVVGVKDNTASKQKRIETLRTLGDDGMIFSDVLEPEIFSIFEEGFGCGQIGSGMPLGSQLSQAFEMFWEGDHTAARQIVTRFSDFKTELLKILGPNKPWHAQIKTLMHAMGVDAGYPRFPSLSLRDVPEKYSEVVALVNKYTQFS